MLTDERKASVDTLTDDELDYEVVRLDVGVHRGTWVTADYVFDRAASCSLGAAGMEATQPFSLMWAKRPCSRRDTAPRSAHAH